MNIQEAMAGCIADLSLSVNTARNYTNGLKRFADFLDGKNISVQDDVGLINIDHFVQFLPWLDKNYSKSSAGVYISASKALLDYLVISHKIELSYLDTIRFSKASIRSHRRREDKLPRFPGKDDVSMMLTAVHEYVEESPIKERNIALLELLASSGCRISEVTALNVADIDLVNRTMVVTGKGSKERRVFFSKNTADALSNYWDIRKSRMATDPVFARHDPGAGHKRLKRLTPTSCRNIVKDIAKFTTIDLTKISPHYFRHAFAIRVLSETGNIALVQDLLGHKDPKSTRVYAKIREEELQEVHRNIFK